ncbi:MAG: T9SS type A sorting domain-containing protein [Ignavibacteriales bacterium]|nr:T9SS type A sorting domain-containing protein [Ignavibacteriales bacterium]
MKAIKISFVLLLTMNYSFSQEDSTKNSVIEFDSLDIAKINWMISQIPSDSIAKFELKYETWIESTQKPEIQKHSNPEYYKTEEYYDFKEYCMGLGSNYIGLLIDFFEDHNTGDNLYNGLLLDITIEDFGDLIDDVHNELDSLNLNGVSWYDAFPIHYFKKILATIKIPDIVDIDTILHLNTFKQQFFNLYPNPIHDYISIEFELVKTETISIKIHNYLGQLQDIIKNEGIYNSGSHTVKWYRKEYINPGIYILSFESGGFIVSKKIVIK